MIVLDTNVLSELMRLRPDPRVVAWVESHSRGALYTTSINQAEIFYGINALPEGKRRNLLFKAAEAVFLEDLKNRILPFDHVASMKYVELATARRKAGQPIEAFDALIAATALAAGAADERRAAARRTAEAAASP